MRVQTFLIVFLSFIMTGCAQMVETVYGLDQSIPSEAPPGYASFQKGLVAQHEKDFTAAQIAFCNAAKLGYQGSESYCEKYTLIEAARTIYTTEDYAFAKWLVCSVRDYGEVARILCQRCQQGYDVAPALYQYVQTVLSAKPSEKGVNLPRASAPTKVKDLVGELE